MVSVAILTEVGLLLLFWKHYHPVWYGCLRQRCWTGVRQTAFRARWIADTDWKILVKSALVQQREQ